VNPADVVNRGIVREEIGIGQAPRGSAAATADPEILYKKRLKEIHSIILVDKSNELEILRDGTPNIGICQDVLDRYFAQRSKLDLVKRPGGVYRLMTNENDEASMAGFFRIAADNRIEKKADSFLNALTPYFGYSSPQQFKQKLQDLMKPPVFLQLNYGNTLFDFYSKSIKDPPNIEKRITAFARTIKMPLTQTIKAPGAEGENEAAAKLYTDTLVRAFKGYQAFEKHFNDNRIIKEYRIFGQFFTNAGFMDATPDGILFVVLELDSKNEIRVRCPPFGVSAEAAERCDYAFLLHYVDTNLWEPLFYTEHNPDAEEPHKSYFIFRQEDKENWPEIVKRRVREFNRLCRSSGLGIYTQIEKGKEITPLLLTLSEARDLATPVELKMTTPADQRITIKYVLRDLYNHINGVVITTKGKLIVVPCVDDGTLLDKENAYDVQLDFRNTIPDLAGFQETRAWYTKFMGPHLTKIGGPLLEKRKALYTIQETAYGEQEEDAAFQSFQIPVAKLGAPGVDYGLFIPVAKTEGVPVTPYTMIPWLVDAQILFGTADPSAKLDVSFTEFQEIYEHLRYTFSNWFSVADPDLRKEVTEILFDAGDGYTINRSYPYWRKRLLLEDAIGGEVRKWLTTDPVSKTVTTFKRVDCRVQKEDTCHTRCVWKGEQGCLLHVPNDPFLLGKTSVRAEDLLVKKLIDELIHYPLQQAELLQKRVYSYQKLKDFVRTDTQYITPESVPSWEEFLRMDWRIQEPEKKKHYEEFTAILEPSEDDLGAAPPLSPAAEGEGEGEGENDEGAASPDSNEGEDEAAVPVAAPAPAAAAAAEEEDEDEEEEEDAPRELGRPPAKVVEKFGPNFYWFPFTDEYSLWTHFTTSPLGFEEEELTAAGQVNEDRSMTLETMKLLASKRGESVFQYDAIAPSEADRNLVVWVKTAAGLKKDFLVHYVDEEHSGFLSASNQADDFSSILFSKLKAPFPSIIAKNKTILVEV
jgi:hypothetical protein